MHPNLQTLPDPAAALQAVLARHPWLPRGLAHRLARAYGSRISEVLGSAESLVELGAEVAPGLHEAELQYLMAQEWAHSAQDVLWRRSKLGLHYSEAERQRVSDWLQLNTPQPSAETP